MNVKIQKRLRMQGFVNQDIKENSHISIIARWTPFACALFGTAGILLKSPHYMWGLGLLTAIGAFNSRSFYDLIYNTLIKPIIKTGKAPKQGNPRRLGCGVGAFLYLLSGTGFFYGDMVLAYIPSVLIITLAAFAAVTHICFASALYQLLFSKKREEEILTNSCCN
jgi:hypothetical protein